ncbi:MAG TPA: hypothetical protein VML55_09650 [Planctomycetaceae bacterium]|nr:hypothetical protein [Planctomycetaceae bacterium]
MTIRPLRALRCGQQLGVSSQQVLVLFVFRVQNLGQRVAARLQHPDVAGCSGELSHQFGAEAAGFDQADAGFVKASGLVERQARPFTRLGEFDAVTANLRMIGRQSGEAVSGKLQNAARLIDAPDPEQAPTAEVLDVGQGSACFG